MATKRTFRVVGWCLLLGVGGCVLVVPDLVTDSADGGAGVSGWAGEEGTGGETGGTGGEAGGTGGEAGGMGGEAGGMGGEAGGTGGEAGGTGGETYSDDLVPATPLNLPPVPTNGYLPLFRWTHVAYVWLEEGQPLVLNVRGGTITHYQDRGNVQFWLNSPKALVGEPVDYNNEVPPDNTLYQIEMNSSYDGWHWLKWKDGGDRTEVGWQDGQPGVLKLDPVTPPRMDSKWRLYFYVPKGTSVLGAYVSNHNKANIYDAAGDLLGDDWKDLDANEGVIAIDIPPGHDGRLWSIQSSSVGVTVALMTVPPQAARNERELLLPKEVVEADAIQP